VHKAMGCNPLMSLNVRKWKLMCPKQWTVIPC